MGVPATRPVAAAASAETRAQTSRRFEHVGQHVPVEARWPSSISSDQRRRATSSSSVPEASATSVAYRRSAAAGRSPSAAARAARAPRRRVRASEPTSSLVSVKLVSAGLSVSSSSDSWPTCSSSHRHSALGALIAPDDRRPQHLAALAEQHRAVHLAGQADRVDRRAPGTRLTGDGPQRLLTCAPPVVRILLRPCGPRRREGIVRRGRRRRNRTVRLHNHCARAAGADVEADD